MIEITLMISILPYILSRKVDCSNKGYRTMGEYRDVAGGE